MTCLKVLTLGAKCCDGVQSASSVTHVRLLRISAAVVLALPYVGVLHRHGCGTIPDGQPQYGVQRRRQNNWLALLVIVVTLAILAITLIISILMAGCRHALRFWHLRWHRRTRADPTGAARQSDPFAKSSVAGVIRLKRHGESCWQQPIRMIQQPMMYSLISVDHVEVMPERRNQPRATDIGAARRR